GLVIVFLLGRPPREVAALGAAGLLLLSRRTASARLLALTDWPLLVLFGGLFIVNHALAATGAVADAMARLQHAGVESSHPATLFGLSVLLSNVVSNVPAVMLLLPAATHPLAGPVLTLSSTLAGNLLLVGSIANLIVVEQAGRLGVRIGWRDHARLGVPVALATLGIAAAWLALRAAMLAGGARCAVAPRRGRSARGAPPAPSRFRPMPAPRLQLQELALEIEPAAEAADPAVARDGA